MPLPSTTTLETPPPINQEGPERPPHQPTERSPVRHHLQTELHTISYLILFSFPGTLARIGLQRLTSYPNAPISSSVLWANVAGCFIMGVLTEDRFLFQRPSQRSFSTNWPSDQVVHSSIDADEMPDGETWAGPARSDMKKTLPIYIGLTTGFCGCLTSFSSFMRDVFLGLSNDLSSPSSSSSSSPSLSSSANSSTGHFNQPRPAGDSFMAVLALLMLTPCVCLCGLQSGVHLAGYLSRFKPPIPRPFPGGLQRVVKISSIFLAFGVWLVVVFISIWPPPSRSTHSDASSTTRRHPLVFPLLFAPLGCLMRYYISRSLNSLRLPLPFRIFIPGFPMGTFAVNILGTIILGVAFDLQYFRRRPSSSASGGSNVQKTKDVLICQILQGIQDGLCGCLTTVSTWVVELRGFKRVGHAYCYGLLSVLAGLGSSVLVMGSVRWSRGFEGAVCL